MDFFHPFRSSSDAFNQKKPEKSAQPPIFLDPTDGPAGMRPVSGAPDFFSNQSSEVVWEPTPSPRTQVSVLPGVSAVEGSGWDLSWGKKLPFLRNGRTSFIYPFSVKPFFSTSSNPSSEWGGSQFACQDGNIFNMEASEASVGRLGFFRKSNIVTPMALSTFIYQPRVCIAGTIGGSPGTFRFTKFNGAFDASGSEELFFTACATKNVRGAFSSGKNRQVLPFTQDERDWLCSIFNLLASISTRPQCRSALKMMLESFAIEHLLMFSILAKETLKEGSEELVFWETAMDWTDLKIFDHPQLAFLTHVLEKHTVWTFPGGLESRGREMSSEEKEILGTEFVLNLGTEKKPSNWSFTGPCFPGVRLQVVKDRPYISNLKKLAGLLGVEKIPMNLMIRQQFTRKFLFYTYVLPGVQEKKRKFVGPQKDKISVEEKKDPPSLYYDFVEQVFTLNPDEPSAGLEELTEQAAGRFEEFIQLPSATPTPYRQEEFVLPQLSDWDPGDRDAVEWTDPLVPDEVDDMEQQHVSLIPQQCFTGSMRFPFFCGGVKDLGVRIAAAAQMYSNQDEFSVNLPLPVSIALNPLFSVEIPPEGGEAKVKRLQMFRKGDDRFDLGLRRVLDRTGSTGQLNLMEVVPGFWLVVDHFATSIMEKGKQKTVSIPRTEMLAENELFPGMGILINGDAILLDLAPGDSVKTKLMRPPEIFLKHPAFPLDFGQAFLGNSGSRSDRIEHANWEQFLNSKICCQDVQEKKRHAGRVFCYAPDKGFDWSEREIVDGPPDPTADIPYCLVVDHRGCAKMVKAWSKEKDGGVLLKTKDLMKELSSFPSDPPFFIEIMDTLRRNLCFGALGLKFYGNGQWSFGEEVNATPVPRSYTTFNKVACAIMVANFYNNPFVCFFVAQIYGSFFRSVEKRLFKDTALEEDFARLFAAKLTGCRRFDNEPPHTHMDEPPEEYTFTNTKGEVENLTDYILQRQVEIISPMMKMCGQGCYMEGCKETKKSAIFPWLCRTHSKVLIADVLGGRGGPATSRATAKEGHQRGGWYVSPDGWPSELSGEMERGIIFCLLSPGLNLVGRVVEENQQKRREPGITTVSTKLILKAGSYFMETVVAASDQRLLLFDRDKSGSWEAHPVPSTQVLEERSSVFGKKMNLAPSQNQIYAAGPDLQAATNFASHKAMIGFAGVIDRKCPVFMKNIFLRAKIVEPPLCFQHERKLWSNFIDQCKTQLHFTFAMNVAEIFEREYLARAWLHRRQVEKRKYPVCLGSIDLLGEVQIYAYTVESEQKSKRAPDKFQNVQLKLVRPKSSEEPKAFKCFGELITEILALASSSAWPGGIILIPPYVKWGKEPGNPLRECGERKRDFFLGQRQKQSASLPTAPQPLETFVKKPEDETKERQAEDPENSQSEHVLWTGSCFCIDKQVVPRKREEKKSSFTAKSCFEMIYDTTMLVELPADKFQKRGEEVLDSEDAFPNEMIDPAEMPKRQGTFFPQPVKWREDFQPLVNSGVVNRKVSWISQYVGLCKVTTGTGSFKTTGIIPGIVAIQGKGVHRRRIVVVSSKVHLIKQNIRILSQTFPEGIRIIEDYADTLEDSTEDRKMIPEGEESCLSRVGATNVFWNSGNLKFRSREKGDEDLPEVYLTTTRHFLKLDRTSREIVIFDEFHDIQEVGSVNQVLKFWELEGCITVVFMSATPPHWLNKISCDEAGECSAGTQITRRYDMREDLLKDPIPGYWLSRQRRDKIEGEIELLSSENVQCGILRGFRKATRNPLWRGALELSLIRRGKRLFCEVVTPKQWVFFTELSRAAEMNELTYEATKETHLSMTLDCIKICADTTNVFIFGDIPYQEPDCFKIGSVTMGEILLTGADELEISDESVFIGTAAILHGVQVPDAAYLVFLAAWMFQTVPCLQRLRMSDRMKEIQQNVELDEEGCLRPAGWSSRVIVDPSAVGQVESLKKWVVEIKPVTPSERARRVCLAPPYPAPSGVSVPWELVDEKNGYHLTKPCDPEPAPSVFRIQCHFGLPTDSQVKKLLTPYKGKSCAILACSSRSLGDKVIGKMKISLENFSSAPKLTDQKSSSVLRATDLVQEVLKARQDDFYLPVIQKNLAGMNFEYTNPRVIIFSQQAVHCEALGLGERLISGFPWDELAQCIGRLERGVGEKDLSLHHVFFPEEVSCQGTKITDIYVMSNDLNPLKEMMKRCTTTPGINPVSWETFAVAQLMKRTEAPVVIEKNERFGVIDKEGLLVADEALEADEFVGAIRASILRNSSDDWLKTLDFLNECGRLKEEEKWRWRNELVRSLNFVMLRELCEADEMMQKGFEIGSSVDGVQTNGETWIINMPVALENTQLTEAFYIGIGIGRKTQIFYSYGVRDTVGCVGQIFQRQPRKVHFKGNHAQAVQKGLDHSVKWMFHFDDMEGSTLKRMWLLRTYQRPPLSRIFEKIDRKEWVLKNFLKGWIMGAAIGLYLNVDNLSMNKLIQSITDCLMWLGAGDDTFRRTSHFIQMMGFLAAKYRGYVLSIDKTHYERESLELHEDFHMASSVVTQNHLRIMVEKDDEGKQTTKFVVLDPHQTPTKLVTILKSFTEGVVPTLKEVIGTKLEGFFRVWSEGDMKKLGRVSEKLAAIPGEIYEFWSNMKCAALTSDPLCEGPLASEELQKMVYRFGEVGNKRKKTQLPLNVSYMSRLHVQEKGESLCFMNKPGGTEVHTKAKSVFRYTKEFCDFVMQQRNCSVEQLDTPSYRPQLAKLLKTYEAGAVRSEEEIEEDEVEAQNEETFLFEGRVMQAEADHMELSPLDKYLPQSMNGELHINPQTERERESQAHFSSRSRDRLCSCGEEKISYMSKCTQCLATEYKLCMCGREKAPDEELCTRCTKPTFFGGLYSLLPDMRDGDGDDRQEKDWGEKKEGKDESAAMVFDF